MVWSTPLKEIAPTIAPSWGPLVVKSAVTVWEPRFGLTRYQISQQTGIEQSALSRFVHGERGLALDNVDLIADLLGLEVTQKKEK